MTPTRFWLRLVPTAACANLLSDCCIHDKAIWVSSLFCVANTVEALVSAILIRKLTAENFSIARLRDVIIFVCVITFAGAPSGAIVGGLTVTTAFGGSFGIAFGSWWSSGVLGALLVTPALTNWIVRQPWREPGLIVRALEMLIFATLTGLMALYIFGYQTRPIVFTVLPLVVIASARQRVCGAVFVTGILSLVTIWETTSGFGPFHANRPIVEQLLLTQVYLAMNIGLSLSVAAVTMQWKAFTAEIERMNSELTRLSSSDPLTEIYNRRKFNLELEKEVSRSERHSLKTSLILLDVDHFKPFNDIYGHQAGDVALKQVARKLVESTRFIDTVARYGGEEFAVILPETDIESGLSVAERIRRSVEQAAWSYRQITVSVGVAEFRPGMSVSDIIEAADSALYRSKFEGRNRVSVYPPVSDSAIDHQHLARPTGHFKADLTSKDMEVFNS